MNDMDDLIGENPAHVMNGEEQDKFAVGVTAPLPQLDERELTFCRLMVKGYKAEDAALMAGYVKRHPREDIGRIIYERPQIRDALRWMQTEYLREQGVTVERVALELARIAFFDPRELFDKEGNPRPIRKLSKATAAALKGVKVKKTDFNGVSTTTTTDYTANDKLKALELMAKHLGMSSDKVELSGPDGGPIQLMTNNNPMETARRVAFLLQQAQREQGGGQTYDAEGENLTS